MRIPEPALFFTLGVLASGVVYTVGRRALAPTLPEQKQKVEASFKRFPLETLPSMAPRVHLPLDFSQPIQVRYEFGADWELNSKAPSWLALFEKSPGQAVYAQSYEFPQESLKQLEFPLGGLKAGSRYLLQGSLYICKKGDHAACAMKSYTYELEPASSLTGGPEQRVIELR